MFEFEFEWDPAKAANNRRKHGIEFEDAATVFLDPLFRSIPDESSIAFEERWRTMGYTSGGRLLVVSHTYAGTEGGKTWVRIISARPAAPNERRQYESGE